MFRIAFLLSSLRSRREIFEISNNQKANLFFSFVGLCNRSEFGKEFENSKIPPQRNQKGL